MTLILSIYSVNNHFIIPTRQIKFIGMGIYPTTRYGSISSRVVTCMPDSTNKTPRLFIENMIIFISYSRCNNDVIIHYLNRRKFPY